jgi:hypothetical protein
MPSLPREQLDTWVDQWLEANRVCEQKGDWKPLADFYTEDATYGWNIGPKEDVMCVGRDEIRDVALGLEMEGLENWVYEYQKVLVDDKLGRDRRLLEADRQQDRRHPGRDLRHRRQLVPARRRRGRSSQDRVAARLLRFRSRVQDVHAADRVRRPQRGYAEADRTVPGR